MMLRAGRNPVTFDYPHSHITRALYGDMIEADILYTARLARLTSWCSLHGHPDADLEGSNQQMRLHFADAIGTIPYITGGKSGVDALQQERLDFAKHFHEYKEQVLQGRDISSLVRKRGKKSGNIQLIGKANDR